MPNNPRQILIVDDNQDIRNLIKVTLLKQGYECLTADGGEAALAALKDAPVDLALIDIIMPGMTGLSLFKRIKELHPEIAIVFVTSIDDRDLAFDSLKDGAYDYIIKSNIPHRLVEAVEQALDRHDANMERNQQVGDLKVLVESQAEELQRKSQEIIALNQVVRFNRLVNPEEAC